MAISLQSYLVLSDALAKHVYRLWHKETNATLLKVARAWRAGRDDEVNQRLHQLTMGKTLDKLDTYLKFVSNAALAYGATRTGHAADPKRMKQDPTLMDGQVALMDQFKWLAGTESMKQIRNQVQWLFTALERADKRREDEAVHKGEHVCARHVQKIDASDFEGPAFSKAFQSFLNGRGEAFMNIASSLHTSRMASWGFTYEAEIRDITEYQIDEQMDNRTCAVCEMMNGKKFQVESARRVLENVLSVDDPNDLKSIAPWPRQDPSSLDAMSKMSDDQLAAAGWNVPPFHPGCRGVLVAGDTSSEVDNVQVSKPTVDLGGRDIPIEHALTTQGKPDTTGTMATVASDEAKRRVEELATYDMLGEKAVQNGNNIKVPIKDVGLVDVLPITQAMGAKGGLSALLETSKVEVVPTSSLVTVQPTVSKKKVLDLIDAISRGDDTGDLPVVINYHGQFVLWDGNHRLAAQFYLGAASIRARVIYLT